MAHSQDTRDRVRKLYIEGMPLTGAAITSGVAYDTARDWKERAKAKGDDWDVTKMAMNISEQGVDDLMMTFVEQMMRQAVVTMRELEAAKIPAATKVALQAQLSDAMSKHSKAMSRINPKLGALSVSFDTLKIIAEYFSKNDKDALRKFQEHLEGLSAVVQARYGQ